MFFFCKVLLRKFLGIKGNDMADFLSISAWFFGCWLAGFIVSVFFVLPFLGVKQVADVASAASGEIRGA